MRGAAAEATEDNAATSPRIAAGDSTNNPATSIAAPAAVEGAAPVAVPAASAKALRYHHSGNAWWVFWRLWGLAVPIVILFSGFSARMRDFARRVGSRLFRAAGLTLLWIVVPWKMHDHWFRAPAKRRLLHWSRSWPVVAATFLFLYFALTFALAFPISYFSDFVRGHEYGLSKQTFGAWLQESLLWRFIYYLGFLVAILVGLWLLQRSPRRWWLYLWLLSLPFMVLVIYITPVFIHPIFDDFQPMQDKELEAKILALAKRAGIEQDRVYEVNKSQDTKAVNAYVVGIGDTKRIVLWDTLIQKCDDDEVLFVMGHEMGHYVLGHVITTTLLIFVLFLAASFVMHVASRWLLARFSRRFGFSRLSDPAAIPLFLLLYNVVFLLFSPLGLWFSRHNEHEADRFGLELTRDNRAAATSFVKLQEENLSNPWPAAWYKVLRSTHPSVGERIEFFNSYRPWQTGEPIEYESLFE